MRQTGDLTTRVRLYRRVPETREGRSADAWEELLPGGLAAEVYSQSDKAFAAGDARYQETIKFCTIRKPVGFRLEPGLRFVHEGMAYDVAEVVPGTIRGTLRLRGVCVTQRGDGVADD